MKRSHLGQSAQRSLTLDKLFSFGSLLIPVHCKEKGLQGGTVYGKDLEGAEGDLGELMEVIEWPLQETSSEEEAAERDQRNKNLYLTGAQEKSRE